MGDDELEGFRREAGKCGKMRRGVAWPWKGHFGPSIDMKVVVVVLSDAEVGILAGVVGELLQERLKNSFKQTSARLRNRYKKVVGLEVGVIRLEVGVESLSWQQKRRPTWRGW